jgi:hypothetical protein
MVWANLSPEFTEDPGYQQHDQHNDDQRCPHAGFKNISYQLAAAHGKSQQHEECHYIWSYVVHSFMR